MNYNFQSEIPKDFSRHSRVWIYQANRQFTVDEAILVEELLEGFANSWLSHGIEVKGYANLFFGQFIIFIADESTTGVSGCSTDSSVRLVKEIEQDQCISLFDRQNLGFIIQETIRLIPLKEISIAIEDQLINPESLYFNNTVQTLGELLNNWIIPIKNSWLADKFSITVSHS